MQWSPAMALLKRRVRLEPSAIWMDGSKCPRLTVKDPCAGHQHAPNLIQRLDTTQAFVNILRN